MSLADYLAKNYLSGGKDQKKSKKKEEKKRKQTESNVVIQDDSPLMKRAKIKDDSDPLETSLRSSTVSLVEAKPKSKPKQSGWKVVGTDEVLTQTATTSKSTSTLISISTLTETEKKEQEEEEEDSTPKMESGANAGLQTAKEVTEQIRLKRERELKYLSENSPDSLGKNSETVYRDRSGRRINIDSKLENERQRREAEHREKERKIKEMNMGLTQKLDLEDQRRKAEENKGEGITRYANDSKLNAELKKKELEDDPLQAFNDTLSTNKSTSRTGRQLYTKGYPENRFNIVPGHRWDGVDRSNGFEKKWFKKQAERNTTEKLSYTMQEDY